MAVNHVLSAIKPDHLKARLSEDLEFAHYDLRKNFEGFFAHAVKVAEAFQIMDNGRKTDGGRSQSQISMTQARGGGSESGQATSQVKKESKTVSKPKKEPPLCPFHVCCSENPAARHYIRDCHKSSQAEKEKMFAKLKADKERDAPAFSTRSKKEESNTKPVTSEPRPAGNVGRLADDRDIPDPRPTCKVAIADGLSSLDITGRCDDGSDDTLASRKVAEAAVIDVIGRIAKINPVELSVALKKGVDAYKCRFSRAWTVPRTTMHLPSGKLAMMNLSFLVAEGELACENIIIGRSVLGHLSIDTAMLLDRNRQLLDDTDCSAVGNPTVLTGAVFVSRVMTARSNSIPNELLSDPNICKLDPARPRAVFDYQWIEDDPFPNPTLLDMVDSDQSVEVHLEVEATLERSKAAGIPDDSCERLTKMIKANTDVFRTKLLSGPPVDLMPLRIELMDNAAPTKVRLRNARPRHRLVEKGMAYRFLDALYFSSLMPETSPAPASQEMHTLRTRGALVRPGNI